MKDLETDKENLIVMTTAELVDKIKDMPIGSIYVDELISRSKSSRYMLLMALKDLAEGNVPKIQ